MTTNVDKRATIKSEILYVVSDYGGARVVASPYMQDMVERLTDVFMKGLEGGE